MHPGGHSENQTGVHRLGDIEVDERLRQIRRAGRVVPVEPKPFDLLVLLIRERRRVVSREELMERIWPGVVVSEATLSSAVRRAREAIAPRRDLIEGVRKVGYRFVGSPDAPAAAAASVTGVPPEASDAGTAAASLYIGRAGALAELGRYLASGIAGNGCVIAVTGEPGMGKTRTIDELVRRHAAGCEALVARCYEGEGGQAFWPWIQIFRAFASGRTPAALAEILGAEASDIARLTSAVPAAADATPLADPEMLRARVFDAAVAVLRRAAARAPLLIVLDDLHWADRASLTLLQAVARQCDDLPLVVVVAYRDLEVAGDHPVAALIASLRREQKLRELPLAPLTRAEAGELLDASAGARVADAAASMVFQASEGNPFFVLEFLRDLQEARALVRGDNGWNSDGDGLPVRAVPAGVAEIIDRRLRRLSAECVHLLAIGAVVGRVFDHEIASEVSSMAARHTIDLLEEAARARVIEEDPQTPGRYRFAHALIRQTLYDGMTALRRAALHRYVAEAIEARIAGAVPSAETTAELAHHFLLGRPAGGARKAIAYAEAAAADATRACAYDSAADYLRNAAAIADEVARGDSQEDRLQQARLHALLGEALGRAGDGAGMRASFDRAAHLARAIPSPPLLAKVAIGMSRNAMLADDAMVKVCEEALDMLPADAAVERAQVQASLARALHLTDGMSERRNELTAQARGAVAGCRDARLLGDVLADCVEAQFNSNTLALRDELTAELCEAAQRSGDPRQLLLGRAWQIVNLMCRGRLTDIEQRLGEFARMAEELRQPRFLHHAAVFEAALLLARGRLSEAEQRCEDALRLGARIDEAAAMWVYWAQLHHIRREQGRFEEFLGEGLAVRLPPGTAAAHNFQRIYRWAAPHVFSELGREDEAKAAFEMLIADGLDGLPQDNGHNARIPVLMGLSESCITAGDARAAGEIYDLLSAYADQWFCVGWGSVVFASTHLMLGGLRGVQQRWDEATAHFEEAMRQHDAEGAACAQARTLYQWARMLVRRGSREDASVLIERALDICGTFGLKGAEQRLLRLRPS